VDIIVPARNEAATIAQVIARSWPRITPVTSASYCRRQLTDDTAATAAKNRKLLVICGEPKPTEWSGKLWALSQELRQATRPYCFFTDADVVHDSRHLCSLVARLLHPSVEMVSEMVKLRCISGCRTRACAGVRVFLPDALSFAKVNDPNSPVAAAAGWHDAASPRGA